MIDYLMVFVRKIPLNNYFEDPEEIVEKVVIQRKT